MHSAHVSTEAPAPDPGHLGDEVREAPPLQAPTLEVGTVRSPIAIVRTRAWAALTIAVAGLVMWGQAMALSMVCLTLAAMVAVALARDSQPDSDRGGFSPVALLPAGLVVVVAWALLWGLAAGIVGFGGWSSRTSSLMGLGALVGASGLLSARQGGRVVAVRGDLPALVGFGLLAGFFGWVIGTQPFAWWSRINGSGTDFFRHLVAVRGVRADGLLDPGAPGYPAGLHALGAWLSSALGLPVSAEELWRAIAPVGFLMLCLILVGVMTAARRLTDVLIGPSRIGVLASAIAAIAFVQTAWFSSFLAFGNVMNMLVGVCLVALLVQGLEPGSCRSRAGAAVAAAAIGVTANAWQLLLPVVGLAAVPWIVGFLRSGRRRAWDWAAWMTGLALAVNGLLGLRNLDGQTQAAAATVSNLFRPDWWWWAASVMAGLAIAGAYRRGRRSWSATALGMMLGGAGLVAFLLHMTGSSWDLMRYYPVKALWTAMVVVVPMACAGAALVGVSLWRAAGERAPLVGAIVRGGIGLTVGILVVGVLGRGAAFQPHLAVIAQGRSGSPNWGMALVESMDRVDVAARSRPGAVVFGLVPSAGVAMIASGYVGMVDYMAMEALDYVGFDDAMEAPVKPGLYQRDMTMVCRYLKDHPDSLRVTGPNPAAGAPWIVDSGCPQSIVKPERWVSVEIDPVWFGRTLWEGGDWYFPTFREFQSATRTQ